MADCILPPAWKLNFASVKVLMKLGFSRQKYKKNMYYLLALHSGKFYCQKF
jgi:hypothetical protein